MDTQARVWAAMKRIAQKRKPQRRTIKIVRKATKIQRVTPRRSLDKYSIMLKRLGDHFGENALPELLQFMADRKAKETKHKF